jgi:hypothetical protein
MQASFCSSAMERRLAIPAACGSRLTNSIRTEDAVKGLGTAFAKSERGSAPLQNTEKDRPQSAACEGEYLNG